LLSSGPNVVELFMNVTYDLNVYNKLVFVPGKPSAMFVDKVRSIPFSGALTRVGSGLAHKHYTRLRIVEDKQSSLLWTFLNCGRNFSL
jgi:hypothetical protein